MHDVTIARNDALHTVVNFHPDDSATVLGITPQDFALQWVDGQGAADYAGLTLHATAAGRPTASLTLTGYSVADLSNGRLTTSFGTVDGSNYLNIHAVG